MVYDILELTIRQQGNAILADIRIWNHRTSQTLAHDVPIALDSTVLKLYLDPQDYGKELNTQVFVDELRKAWDRAVLSRKENGTPLRVLVHIQPSAKSLHSLWWETLRDPYTNTPLAMSEQFILSRYMESEARLPTDPPPLNSIHVLCAVANPPVLPTYQFTKIDVDGELKRVRRALGTLQRTELGMEVMGTPANLKEIALALRDGANILYLVCHGRLSKEEEPLLWLEQDSDAEERYQPITGRAVIEQLENLSVRPLLVVLASCQSAGSGDMNALAALGPRLIRAGVGAVVAMQGNVPMITVKCLMPTFFNELQRDGRIDRALAAARGTLRKSDAWWMPVLWMQIRDGILWREDTHDHVSPAVTTPHVATPSRILSIAGDAGNSFAAHRRRDIEAIQQHFGSIAVTQVEPSTGIGRLVPLLAQYRPDLLHISGRASSDGLYWSSASAGLLRWSQLATTLQSAPQTLILVVLLADYSRACADVLRNPPFRMIVASGSLNQADAQTFIESFYAMLAGGMDTVSAFRSSLDAYPAIAMSLHLI